MFYLISEIILYIEKVTDLYSHIEAYLVILQPNNSNRLRSALNALYVPNSDDHLLSLLRHRCISMQYFLLGFTSLSWK